MENPFIEIDFYQAYKDQQPVGGDVFLSKKLKDENRIISVLSDGLGSGIKANVLSTLTSSMALNYVSNNFDIKKTAQVIMKTLPVCKVRKISYATFSIVDIHPSGKIKIIEYDNPSFLLIRNGRLVSLNKQTMEIDALNKRTKIHFSEFQFQLGDRIIFYSDGVSQSGIGTTNYPLGWGEEGAANYISQMVLENNQISARDLSKKVVSRALKNDKNKAGDDITCGVINIRNPRELLILSGPPISRNKDAELARITKNFSGDKIICGGTTAKIISRELNLKMQVNLADFSNDVPPTCSMDGISLVTEGTITLAKVVEMLEQQKFPELSAKNGATKLVERILNSDIIHFVIGTKINDAHQDPNVPVELEIRRNIFKKIIRIIEEKYLKTTSLQFI